MYGLLVVAVLALTAAGQYRGDFRSDSFRKDSGSSYEPHRTRLGYGNQHEIQRLAPPPLDKRRGHFSYKETSYGYDSFADLDPYTKRALENSYHIHNADNLGENPYKRRINMKRYRERPENPRYAYQKQGSHESTRPTGSDDDDDCSMMKDPRGMMGSVMMKEGCRSYKAWGKAMQKPMKWKPTQSQMDWWESLSMPLEKRKALNSRRHKRQATPLRREYRALSDSERRAFHNAVRSLKTNSMDGMNMYDIFVGFHQSRMAPSAHFGCSFYPWHRELLFRFERALQTVDPTVTLPYFDSNLDFHLGDDLATQTVTWTEDFAGNGNGRVTTGPFADWSLPFPIDNQRFLFRNLTFAPRARTAPSLMTDEALSTILNARRLRNICWNIDSSFETYHGATHNWVGGTMVNLPSSPSDPMFFLHHGFIDCLWSWMRDNQRDIGVDVQYDYPNDTVAMGVGMRRQGDGMRIDSPEQSLHYSLAEMRPFGIRNIDGLSSFYDEVVQCAPRPTCSRYDNSCGGSDYLFCDESTYRCAPKLRLGAPCERISRYSPCARGTCCNGICRRRCRDNGPDHGEENEITAEGSDERPRERPAARPDRRPTTDDGTSHQPDSPPRETDPRETDIRPGTEESQPETPIDNHETVENIQRSEFTPNSPNQGNIDDRRPVEVDGPSNTDNNVPPSRPRDSGFPRAHPGVPTHAPYVVPTLPPVPTHPPYTVRLAPTHAPDHGANQVVPTHPPSIFENNRNIVKRDERSVKSHYEDDDYFERKPRPYRTTAEYEENAHPEYEHEKRHHFDEYPYRFHRRPYHTRRYHATNEKYFQKRIPNRIKYNPQTGRDREDLDIDYKDPHGNEGHRHRFFSPHLQERNYHHRLL